MCCEVCPDPGLLERICFLPTTGYALAPEPSGTLHRRTKC
jgi:hypothetical protein